MSPKSSLKKVLTGIAACSPLAYASAVLAANPDVGKDPGSIGDNLDAIGNATFGAGTSAAANQISLPALIGSYINAALGLLGIVFVLYTIYAGFLYFNSRGDAKKAEDATKIITNCVIGLVIIFAAYAISNFVIDAVISSSGVSGV